MATPQIPGGKCHHCQASIVDMFAEWTDEYQTIQGKQGILAGDTVFDCYYCGPPLQLVLPLDLIAPKKTKYRIAKRKLSRCQIWLLSQHPGQSLSQVVEAANWKHHHQWAFDGYNWAEGITHHHGQDTPPVTPGTTP